MFHNFHIFIGVKLKIHKLCVYGLFIKKYIYIFLAIIMWDSNQQEILLFLIVFPKLFSLNTFEEIHCQNILFWFCFSLILSPCFWVNISAWPTFFFLLKMLVQFLMYDACQHVDMLHQTLYLKQKYWVVKILECIYVYWNHDFYIFLYK